MIRVKCRGKGISGYEVGSNVRLGQTVGQTNVKNTVEVIPKRLL